MTIISIGFLTNLDDLLHRPADSIDAHDGLSRVRAKVVGLSVMGGTYPSGKEYNFSFAGGSIHGGPSGVRRLAGCGRSGDLQLL